MFTKIHIPKEARIFLLEDSLERIDWFRKKVPSIHVCSTADAAIQDLSASKFDFFFLDHDLGLLDYAGICGSEGDGKKVAKYMNALGIKGSKVLIHSWNKVGASEMAKQFQGTTLIPFGNFDIVLI